jgi:intracellular sulfur oxidation DsrE/DsrF family protein
MDMDVLFHIEEEVAVTRLTQDIAAIKNFLDDTHDSRTICIQF